MTSLRSHLPRSTSPQAKWRDRDEPLKGSKRWEEEDEEDDNEVYLMVRIPTLKCLMTQRSKKGQSLKRRKKTKGKKKTNKH